MICMDVAFVNYVAQRLVQQHHCGRKSASTPQQPAAAPSTLQGAVLALPPTCLWAVQHAQSDNHGLTVAQAIA